MDILVHKTPSSCIYPKDSAFQRSYPEVLKGADRCALALDAIEIASGVTTNNEQGACGSAAGSLFVLDRLIHSLPGLRGAEYDFFCSIGRICPGRRCPE